jgi:hypothetical protein
LEVPGDLVFLQHLIELLFLNGILFTWYRALSLKDIPSITLLIGLRFWDLDAVVHLVGLLLKWEDVAALGAILKLPRLSTLPSNRCSAWHFLWFFNI